MNIGKILIGCLLCLIIFVFIMIIVHYMCVNDEHCYPHTYLEYPCQGATFYERSHRNNNEPCEKTDYICD